MSSSHAYALDCSLGVVHLPLDEASGSTTFVDKFGENDNAVCTDCPTLENPGQVGTSVEFDGTESIDLDGGDGESSVFDSAVSQRTIMLWVYPNSVEGTQVIFEEGGTVNGLNIYLDEDNIRAGAWSESSDWDGFWLQGSIARDTWTHLAFTYDGSNNMILYKNGVLVEEEEVPGNVSSHTGNDALATILQDTKIHTGDVSGSNINSFNGRIDDFYVFNRVLSSEEINAYLTGDRACEIGFNNLVYLKFNEESPRVTTFNDLYGGNDDGTCSNTTCPTTGFVSPTINWIQFDGENDFVFLDNPSTNSNPTFDDEFAVRTIMLCYNATDLNGTQMLFEEGGASNGANIYITGNKIYAGAWSASRGFEGNWINTNTNANSWHHIALVYDNPNNKMIAYYDGTKIETKTAPEVINAHSGNDAIGAMNNDTRLDRGNESGNNFYFAGLINEFKVFANALTENEILNHSNCIVPYQN